MDYLYHGNFREDGKNEPVSWEVPHTGLVQNVQPPHLARRLMPACFLAHVNHQNLLDHHETTGLPTPVSVIRREVMRQVEQAAK